MNITKFLNKVYFAPRLKEIEQYTSHAGELQQLVLQRLVRTAANTEWGKKHDYASIRTYEDFKKRLPIQTYEEVKPYVTRLRAGEQNLLWPSEIRWFAKSSGTTNDKSKFLPVSRESLHDTHYKGGRDAVAIYLGQNPESRFFSGKGLILGGSHAPNLNTNHSLVGDLSAILIEKYQPTGKLCPRTQQADSLDGALRAQNGGHCPRNHPCKCKQPFRCTVLDACTHQTYTGKDGKAEPRRDMAQPGGILPRRRCLHSLPRAIQRRDP